MLSLILKPVLGGGPYYLLIPMMELSHTKDK